MKAFSYVCGILLLTQAVTNVDSLTNSDFYDLVKSYITEETVVESNESDDVDNDVIYLPGGPDDEIDIERLMTKIEDSFNNEDNEDPTVEYDKEHSLSRSCWCGRHYCKCCGSRRFSVKVWRRRISFTLRACVKVELRSRGFEISFTLNGRRVLHRRYSLRRGISLCYRVPQFPAAKICLGVYNINLRRRSMCVRLTGKVNLRIKRFRVHLNLGCFRLRAFEENDVEGIDPFSENLDMISEKSVSLNDFPNHQEQPNFGNAAIDDLDSKGDPDLSDPLVDDVEARDDETLKAFELGEDIRSEEQDLFFETDENFNFL